MPADRPIYFSVDFDAQAADQAALFAYFDGVASVIGLQRTGVYGGYNTVKWLFDAGKIKWAWQAYAWSYGNWDSRAQLRQVLNTITAAGDGGCCDKDEAVAPDFGQWHAQPAVAPTTGYFDLFDHTTIAGWVLDPSAPSTAASVDLYFDNPAGTPNALSMRVVAGNHRDDLCKAIGSCDHGFSINTPVGILDGKSHTVYAYGVDAKGKAQPQLNDSPKNADCPNATPPLDTKKGVRRRVDPGAVQPWGFSTLLDIAPEPDAVINGFPESAHWIDKPMLVQADDGTPAVWLIDGNTRRHIVDPASLAAWHRTVADVVKTPAAKVNAYPQGPDLPATPFVMNGSSMWVLDVPPSTPPSDTGSGPNGNANGGDGSGAGSGGGGGDSGGCAVRPSSPESSPMFGIGLVFACLAIVRKRRATPVT
jgi:hypothetical protein